MCLVRIILSIDLFVSVFVHCIVSVVAYDPQSLVVSCCNERVHECAVCVMLSPSLSLPLANNESSEVCGIIKPGRRVKLNRSQAVNVHQLLTIRYLPRSQCI